MLRARALAGSVTLFVVVSGTYVRAAVLNPPGFLGSCRETLAESVQYAIEWNLGRKSEQRRMLVDRYRSLRQFSTGRRSWRRLAWNPKTRRGFPPPSQHHPSNIHAPSRLALAALAKSRKLPVRPVQRRFRSCPPWPVPARATTQGCHALADARAAGPTAPCQGPPPSTASNSASQSRVARTRPTLRRSA